MKFKCVHVSTFVRVLCRFEAGILHEQFDGEQQPTARSVSGERAQLRHRERLERHVQRLRRRHSRLQRRRYD